MYEASSSHTIGLAASGMQHRIAARSCCAWLLANGQSVFGNETGVRKRARRESDVIVDMI